VSSRGELVFDHDDTLWTTVDGVRRIAHPERSTTRIPLHIEDIADAYIDADGLTSRTVPAFLVDRELIGPGAWSIDARLFGWRRLEIRDRKSEDSPPGE
jgi:hypothetical protein